MKMIDFFDKYDKPIVIALGFFDCVHIGHQKLINEAKSLARATNSDLAVFTFSNNPFALFRCNTYEILTFTERAYKLETIGVDLVISAHMNEAFANFSAVEFIDSLLNNFQVKGIVSGTDYTYGKKGKGNVLSLKMQLDRSSIPYKVISLVDINNIKVSSTNIRNLVKAGEVSKVRDYLGGEYFIQGEVVHGAGRGYKLGYPTANIIPSKVKLQLMSAVYATYVMIDGCKYYAITNVGNRPTFNEDEAVVESYIENFDKVIYGETITVYFLEKIRDICFFASKNELIEQLDKDKIKLQEVKARYNG